MKQMKFLIMLAALALSSVLASAGQITHTVTYDPSKLSIKYDTINDNIYARVNYENLLSQNLDGEPELPIDNLLFSVPYNASNFVVKIQVNNFTDITINNPVYPAQSPKELDDTTTSFTQPIASIYGMTSFYPSNQCKIVSTGYIYGDNNVVLAQLSPVSYKPSTTTLRIATNISLSIDYDIDSSIVPSLSRNNSAIKEKEIAVVAQNVVNSSSVAANSYTPPESSRFIGEGSITLPTYNYCIITNRELEPAFKKIIAMKRQKGLSAGVVCMEDLMASPICNGGDNQGGLYPTITDSAGVVREYLRYAFNSSTSPTQYVMMGGNAKISPIRYSFSNGLINNKNSFHTPTDMYFSDLSLPWIHLSSNFDNVNESGYIIPDSVMLNNNIQYNPDIFVGRLLCSNKKEIDNYSNKLFRYTFNPGNGEMDYLTKAVIISSGTVFNMENVLLSYLGNNMFSDVAYIKNDGINHLSGAQTIEYIKSNPKGYLSLYAHGEPQSMAIYDKSEKHIITALDSNLSTDSVYNVIEEDGNGLDNLNNKLYPNICYSISCVTMPYDIGEKFYCYTTNEGKCNFGSSYVLGNNYGGPAYLGNTRKGCRYRSECLEKEFLKSINERHLYSVGKAEAFSKVYYKQGNDSLYNHVILEHNLLGDPEFEMWTSEPQQYEGINVRRSRENFIINGVTSSDIISYCDNEGNVGSFYGSDAFGLILHLSPSAIVMIYNHEHIPYIAPFLLQNCDINNSQFIYASSFSAGRNVLSSSTPGNVTIKNGAIYEIEATDDVLLGEGFIVESGATFAIKTPGKVTIDGCVFQSGAKVKIEAGKVEVAGKFTAERGSKVEMTKFVDE